MNNSTAKAKPKMTVKNGVVYGDALSAQEKKRIVMQKKKDRKAKKVRKSAQQTIPYVEMCRDGICKVNSRLYTKSIAFEDINYQLAQNEDKTAIFENWCDFLNYFDSSIFVQLSFINQKASLNEFRKRINIPAQEDAFNDIRSEYSGMLQSQLTKGNNGLVKRKYITFGIEADSLRTAKPKLERIETDILNISLKFSPVVETVVKDIKRNPKRMQREAKKQMLEIGIGTKSQQALKLQQEQNKQERKEKSRKRKEAEEQRMFELKQRKKLEENAKK